MMKKNKEKTRSKWRLWETMIKEKMTKKGNETKVAEDSV